MQRCCAKTPVIAIEYEFYFVDAQRTADGQPQPPKGPLTGRREFRTQINSMADLNEYSPLLAEIDRACRLQNVPATTALAEYGPGQYEVNLAHAAVIHNDITTADGEFDIFQNITAEQVQRVANTYFTKENRLVMTIMPSGGAR